MIETVPGTKAIAQRIINAENDFAETLVGIVPSLSADDARKLTAFYLKKKLAKLDLGIGRIGVKHGGYLDPEAIARALVLANGGTL